ncbi:hypothetical protein LB503_009951 [Fusarium chuoi]|nr:hypothetical protein LB503_009951 [Fusarium chuoi]
MFLQPLPVKPQNSNYKCLKEPVFLVCRDNPAQWIKRRPKTISTSLGSYCVFTGLYRLRHDPVTKCHGQDDECQLGSWFIAILRSAVTYEVIQNRKFMQEICIR